MSRIKSTLIAFAIVATLFATLPTDAQADGPLRRWLRGLRNRDTCATPVLAPTVANYTPNAYGLQPGQCMKTCEQTCSRTVVNYVPQTAYRTNWNRVPVTTYKPETTSDPCTGCTVTCMKPCTTYTYQAQRVPYTTYRPVYRQETYKVPVTTITNDCATGNCGTAATDCTTCGTGVANQAPVLAPQTTNYAPSPTMYGAQPTYAPQPTYGTPTYGVQTPPSSTTIRYENVPTGTINPNGGYQENYSPTEADQRPSLLDGVNNPQTSQRAILDRQSQTRGYPASTPAPAQEWNPPATINFEDQTARSPVRDQWSYSPVRTASYSKPVESNVPQYVPRTTTEDRQSTNGRNGWVEVK